MLYCIMFHFFFILFTLSFLWSRQESNLDLELRKLLYYPLYYETFFKFQTLQYY